MCDDDYADVTVGLRNTGLFRDQINVWRDEDGNVCYNAPYESGGAVSGVLYSEDD